MQINEKLIKFYSYDFHTHLTIYLRMHVPSKIRAWLKYCHPKHIHYITFPCVLPEFPHITFSFIFLYFCITTYATRKLYVNIHTYISKQSQNETTLHTFIKSRITYVFTHINFQSAKRDNNNIKYSIEGD